MLHPIVKWAGGKTQIIEKLLAKCPKKFNKYYEPFVGGGALYFSLMPEKAVINDTNRELIAVYKCLRSKTMYEKMIQKIDEYVLSHSEENYYKVRDIDRKPEFKQFKLFEKAARTIYINKTCFNGLYRVNAKGYFNVPFNGNLNPNCYEKENIDSVHEFMKKTKPVILMKDFEKAVATAQKGDFVYFDPPYDTLDDKNSFTTYTKDSFGKPEQERLAKLFKELSNKGVYVMASNHNTKFVNELYAGFNIEVVQARRSINAKGDGRGKVEEVIITNY